MRTNARALAVIAAVVVMTACSGEPYAARIEKRWAGGTVRRIELQEVNGSVTIDAGAGDGVELLADVSSRGISPTNGDNKGFFRSDVDGDTLTIGRKRSSVNFSFFNRSKLTVNYALHVPVDTDVQVRTVNGAVTLHGVNGVLRVSSVNGAIDISTAGRHELIASTINGEVRANFRDAFQGARLKTVNGGVTAMLPVSASFDCDLSQVNGDFEASYPLSIHSTPGSRRVSGDVNGGQHELHITTVNGDIALKNTPVPPTAPAAPAMSAGRRTSMQAPSAPAPPAPPATAASLTTR